MRLIHFIKDNGSNYSLQQTMNKMHQHHVRTAGSSLANPYACVSAGYHSLWGKSHGGANEAVMIAGN